MLVLFCYKRGSILLTDDFHSYTVYKIDKMELSSPTLKLELPIEQYEHVKPCEDNKQTQPDTAPQSDPVNREPCSSDEAKLDLSSSEQKADDVEVQKSHKHRRRKSAENKSNRNSITSTKMKSLKQIVDKAIEVSRIIQLNFCYYCIFIFHCFNSRFLMYS